MSNAAFRNMAVMLWSMSFIKNLDQEDPLTIRNIRIFFAVYTLLGFLLNFYLHRLILKKSDQTPLKVPPAPPSPFNPPPATTDPNNPSTPSAQWKSIMEYDLSTLSQSRFSFISNCVILTLVHFKMGTIAPMVMSAIMGLNRFWDDPLVQLYVVGKPATGVLERPFKADKAGMMALLKGFMGGDKEEGREGEAGREQEEEESEDDKDEVVIEEVEDDDEEELESKKDK